MKMHINLITSKGRPAIAMVELIFAIVVIGITLLSVPLMVNQATQSTYTTLQQEAIAAAASDMSLILSREWDENNTDDELDSTILETTGTSYDEADRTNLRSRTYYTSTGGKLSPSTLGPEGDLDDIDDVHNTTTTLISLGGSDLIDQNMTITTTVSYINPNIKGISITLTEGAGTPTELDKTITLNAFSCNIGSYKLERKVFE